MWKWKEGEIERAREKWKKKISRKLDLYTCNSLLEIPNLFVFVYCCCDKKKTVTIANVWEGKIFDLSFCATVHNWGKLRQELQKKPTNKLPRNRTTTVNWVLSHQPPNIKQENAPRTNWPLVHLTQKYITIKL